ncbi:MAG: DUF1801 domain-containing protein [Candidatus Acidiferrales bacterium]
MATRKPQPKTIAAYIDAAPMEARKKLLEMRACIRKVAPGAKESIKWRMPAFSYRRILVLFAAFEHHIGFYPTRSAMSAFAKELSKFATGRGSIQFPLEKPLPLALIRKITALRVRESLEQDGKWKTGGRTAP